MERNEQGPADASAYQAPPLSLCAVLCLILFLQPVVTDARKNKPDQAVSVEKQQAQFDIRRFDPNNIPNPGPVIPPGLNAATPYNFSCYQESWLDNVGEFTDTNGTVHLQQKPSWFRIKLALDATTWVPFTASEKLKEHEDGHIRLYKAIYETYAERAAKAAGESLIGHVFEGTGPDVDTARKDIMHQVTMALCSQYHASTRDIAVKADTKYDTMTNHGRNALPTATAVQQTITEVIQNQQATASPQ